MTTTWFTIGRVVGHVEPIVCRQAETQGDAIAWAVAEYEIPPGQVVVTPVPPDHLPPRKDTKPRKRRTDFARKRAASGR